MCGTVARPTQSLLLGTNQTVRNAIVYLAGYAQGNPSLGTDDTIVLDQRDCEFVPRIQVARSGMTLTLRNSDPILHVVRIDLMSSTNEQRMILRAATPYAGFEKVYHLANFREPTLLQVTSGQWSRMDGRVYCGYAASVGHANGRERAVHAAQCAGGNA